GVDRVGITDNFFRLGGHSILLVKLLAKVKKLLDHKLMMRDFFEFGTIQLLAEKINKQSGLSETNIAFAQVTTKLDEQTEEIVL
ncbi:MAG: phosphopantetheine-binding protein, partial [Pseudomonadota bacterium]